jgi:lipoprotein-anchoring transpeptidase ErfK/SrfK
MSVVNRRKLLSGAAALSGATLLGGPALAQRRAPSYNDPDEGFYDTRPPRESDFPFGRGQGVEADPYRGTAPSADPYGGQTGFPESDDPYGPQPRRRAAPGRPIQQAPAQGAAAVDYARAYAAVPGEPFPVPAFRWRSMNPAFLRQPVSYSGPEAPGTIVIDPRARHLFLVESGGRAMRYGVGVGRQGFAWAGAATINSKQEWPDWYPPKEMLQRQPELARQMSELQSGVGMHGGPRNPLGARALYLWQGNKDTLYRIHGTVEPHTIGQSVSSGCIRMINQDAIDLYARIPVGTRVVVRA